MTIDFECLNNQREYIYTRWVLINYYPRWFLIISEFKSSSRQNYEYTVLYHVLGTIRNVSSLLHVQSLKSSCYPFLLNFHIYRRLNTHPFAAEMSLPALGPVHCNLYSSTYNYWYYLIAKHVVWHVSYPAHIIGSHPNGTLWRYVISSQWEWWL